MFVLADTKWGTPTLGETGGIVQWNADLSSGLVYDENLYDAEDFDEALFAAFEVWEDVADINFVQSLTDAEITVEMGALSGNTVGLASLTFLKLTGTDKFINADLTLDSDEEWAPFGETDLSFYAVAVHEIGHALGLLHVDDETQIMHEFLTADDLGDGDIEGAVTIYGEAPVPAFETDDDTNMSFIERFFEIILSLFGLSSGTSIEAVQAAPWSESDVPDLFDIIPITQILDENGEPYEIVTVVHHVPDPDGDAREGHHPAGCSCGCEMGHDHEYDPLFA